MSNNWKYISGTDWMMLLSKQPRFEDKCDWSKLSGLDWAILLTKQVRFADRCDWSKFGGREWTYLLSECPQFADKCDWGTLNGSQWLVLLRARPEFADRCDFSTFSGADIVRLARQSGRRAMPQLARRFEECDLDKLSASEWCGILALYPELSSRFEESAHDFEKDIADAMADDEDMVPAEEFFHEKGA